VGTIVQLDMSNDYPNARKMLTAVEDSRGTETAVLFALDMTDAGLAYVIARHGVAYLLDELTNSATICDALAHEMRARWRRGKIAKRRS
jgi:hypothetical protein